MKMKMFTMLCALSLGTTAAFAQKGVEDGSRFGHGEDSIRCLQNISIYSEYVKTDNFTDAYKPWMAVFTEAPLAQVSTYTNGAKILRALIASSKDAAQQKKYLYDQRIKYLDGLNQLVRTPTTKGSILGMKAHDYIAFSGANIDINKAYQMVKEAVDLEKAASDYFMFQDLMDISARKLKSDDTHNAYFINSGAASCENLQAIYGPKVSQNKTNLDYLKQVINVMQMLKCTEEEAYFVASEAAHAIEPTAATAAGCGYMYYKKGDMDKSVQYFDQAIELEQEADKKADYAYSAAVVLFSKKQLSKAKQYANKAISFNGSYGKAYILIAQMYASSPNWSDEAALNKCTYFAAIDKLQRAKSVDPSVAEEAQKLINTYAGHTPKDEDLFFLGLKKGNSVTIGGWIGETTTIR